LTGYTDRTSIDSPCFIINIGNVTALVFKTSAPYDCSVFLHNDIIINSLMNTSVPPELDGYISYLNTSGAIVNPAGGALVNWQYGKYKTISTTEANSVTDVTNELLKAKNSHLIEFAMDREINFLDDTEIRLHDQVYNSYVSSVRIKSDTNKYIYTSGELQTGLIKKIKEMAK